jgi:hypothetical protein
MSIFVIFSIQKLLIWHFYSIFHLSEIFGVESLWTLKNSIQATKSRNINKKYFCPPFVWDLPTVDSFFQRKTKLIIFSQLFESLRFCFSFWRFEAEAIFLSLLFGGQGTRPFSDLSLGFEKLVAFWRQIDNYFVREFLDFQTNFRSLLTTIISFFSVSVEIIIWSQPGQL